MPNIEWLPRSAPIIIRQMHRRWMTIILLLLGVPLCLLATCVLGFLIETAIGAVSNLSSKRALFASDVGVGAIAIVYVNFYIAWAWLVLKRKFRKHPAGFEVLPPKR